jgi:hypothetical protein
MVKHFLRLYSFVHALVALMLAGAALVLLVIAGRVGVQAISKAFDGAAALGVIESIGLIAIAVVALQISQTIAEEEVIREAHVSAPTRVRRFLSRFTVVIVVALAIEGLVATFKALHENMAQLPYAAALLVATATLLAGWGVFVRLNGFAEQLEPEAMEQAKDEDKKLD